jgi:arsenite methyltransferase
MFTEFRLKMLNREAASPKNKSSTIIKNLNLREGMTVGDIGSGGGYFTHEFSRKVGNDGQVYAIDVNGDALDYISSNMSKEGINNVKTIRANPNGSNLPFGVDIFFLRNVFHHLHDQEGYFRNIKEHLNQDGQIAIIDFNKKQLSFCGLLGHYTPDDVLLDVMSRAGYYLQEKHDFLPSQLFMIFAKNGE